MSLVGFDYLSVVLVHCFALQMICSVMLLLLLDVMVTPGKASVSATKVVVNIGHHL